MKTKQPMEFGEQRNGRRHTNTTGRRQIKRGKTRDQVVAMSRRLRIPIAEKPWKPE